MCTMIIRLFAAKFQDRSGQTWSGMVEPDAALTHSLIHHFENIPYSRKLQTTTEMWLLKDFKIRIA